MDNQNKGVRVTDYDNVTRNCPPLQGSHTSNAGQTALTKSKRSGIDAKAVITMTGRDF